MLAVLLIIYPFSLFGKRPIIWMLPIYANISCWQCITFIIHSHSSVVVVVGASRQPLSYFDGIQCCIQNNESLTIYRMKRSKNDYLIHFGGRMEKAIVNCMVGIVSNQTEPTLEWCHCRNVVCAWDEELKWIWNFIRYGDGVRHRCFASSAVGGITKFAPVTGIPTESTIPTKTTVPSSESYAHSYVPLWMCERKF